VVAIIGILAAIALPAYQDYTIKSQTTSALAEVTPGKIGFELAVNEGNTPNFTTTSAGFIGVTTTGGTYCDLALTAPTATVTGTLECTIKNSNPLVTGKLLTLERSSGGIWACVTDITDAKHFPGKCQ
jgi:type IV pilus assembly protein PilA